MKAATPSQNHKANTITHPDMLGGGGGEAIGCIRAIRRSSVPKWFYSPLSFRFRSAADTSTMGALVLCSMALPGLLCTGYLDLSITLNEAEKAASSQDGIYYRWTDAVNVYIYPAVVEMPASNIFSMSSLLLRKYSLE